MLFLCNTCYVIHYILAKKTLDFLVYQDRFTYMPHASSPVRIITRLHTDVFLQCVRKTTLIQIKSNIHIHISISIHITKSCPLTASLSLFYSSDLFICRGSYLELLSHCKYGISVLFCQTLIADNVRLITTNDLSLCN